VRNIVEGHQADGVIFSGILHDDPRIAFLLERGFPFVTLGRSHNAAQGHAFVDIDSDWAAHAATRRLLEGGHRRVALVNPDPTLAYSVDRIEGYQPRAHAEFGLTPDPALTVGGDLTTRHGKAAALALRSASRPRDRLRLRQRIHRPWRPRPACTKPGSTIGTRGLGHRL
jgi:DNA-binding LacI/PurR family transcriptional regulator